MFQANRARPILLVAVAASSALLLPGAARESRAEERATSQSGQIQVAGRSAAGVLKLLGAKLEGGVSEARLTDYTRHFDVVDVDHDGKHTTEEYVDKGQYMTLQARRGIFRAADANADGVVTKTEYVLNRIVTDEAKEIIQKMDVNRNGTVQKAEFLENSSIDDKILAEAIFRALDTSGDGTLLIPEYLRVWGQWARAGRPTAEKRVPIPEAPADSAQASPGRGPFRGGPPAFGPGARRPGFAPGGLGDRLASAGLEVGRPFPDVSAFDADGKPFELSTLRGQYTVLVGACLTCPAFRASYQGIEAVHRDYAPKGVRFYYVYRALAHPGNNGYVKPFTLAERLMHVREAKQKLGTSVAWLCDNMDNGVKRAMGHTNNSQFILDPQGKIAHLRTWSSGQALREALQQLVGPVTKPTRVEDLNLPQVSPRQRSTRKVLQPIEVPGIMLPLKIEPKPGGKPFYVKLRAEAEQSVLQSGRGKIYLGFHVDPLYRVHWNNLVDPIRFEIAVPPEVTLTPSSGAGPKVETPSDSDPREFLLAIRRGKADAPLELTVRYFACSDDPAWCRAITQQYTIHLARDPFGGAAFGRTFVPGGPFAGHPGGRAGGRPGGFPGGPGPQAGRPGFGGPPSAEMLFSRFDRNGDGQLSEDEVPAPMWQRMSAADANGDGEVTRDEFQEGRNRRPDR